MNIQFNYEYRDAGNYKEFGEVIFSNPNNLDLTFLKTEIVTNLIDEVSFVANKIRIIELFFGDANSDDHDWHNFLNIEITTSPCNDIFNRTIEDFIKELKSQKYRKQLIC